MTAPIEFVPPVLFDQYTDLSQITGWLAVTFVETLQFAGTVSVTLMEVLACAFSVTFGPCTSPVGVMKTTSTAVSTSPGFCMRTQVSKPAAVEPSAMYHVGLGLVTPTESCPSILLFQYTARSAMTGWSAVTFVETLYWAGTILPTSTLTREFAGTFTTGPGIAPAGVMNVRVAFASEPPGFCIAIHVSKPPSVDPSARYQVLDAEVTPIES